MKYNKYFHTTVEYLCGGIFCFFAGLSMIGFVAAFVGCAYKLVRFIWGW